VTESQIVTWTKVQNSEVWEMEFTAAYLNFVVRSLESGTSGEKDRDQYFVLMSFLEEHSLVDDLSTSKMVEVPEEIQRIVEVPTESG